MWSRLSVCWQKHLPFLENHKDMDKSHYDKHDKASIFDYSKKLINHCLRDFAPEAEERSGKGGLGQLVEELFFGYDVNSNDNADFADAGIELKCTPLKQNRQKEFSIKERLVCGMINYKEDWNKSFEESHFYKKCMLMLLLFYLYESGVSRLDLRFLFAVLWQLPKKDILIMKQDYEVIITKIRNGLAHTLSEGDTMYLGACRKGQKGDSLMEQHGSATGAPRRAWSLKMAYMRIVLDEIIRKNEGGAYSNFVIKPKAKSDQLVQERDLLTKSFDEIILERFSPFLHKDYEEYCKLLGKEAVPSKSKYFIMANRIVSKQTVSNVNRAEEFLKAGLTMKTIRVQRNGTIKESMSFENIDYQEVYDNDNWFESRLYELFSSRFLFVIFRETEGKILLSDGSRENRYVLDDVFFWTMPQTDLTIAQQYWENIRECVVNNTIAPTFFWKLKDKKNFHVRPKGRIAADMAPNPHGGWTKKYCYWFNAEYVKNIIDKHNVIQ